MSKFSNGHGNVSKMKDVLYLKTEKFESEIVIFNLIKFIFLWTQSWSKIIYKFKKLVNSGGSPIISKIRTCILRLKKKKYARSFF
jgi:hypothetical protein